MDEEKLIETEPVGQRCNFCGRAKEEVEVVIKGIDETYICSNCVTVCQDLVQQYRITETVKFFLNNNRAESNVEGNTENNTQ